MSDWKRDIGLLVVLQLALGLPYLNSVPRTYVDEVWDSSLGYTLANTGSLKHPFVDGLGGMDIHYLPPRVILPLVCAAVFKVTDYSIAAGRVGSVFFGVLAVVSLYSVARRWFGGRQAFFAALTMVIHPWFFEVSRRTRPEVYYIALSLFFLWLLTVFFERGLLKAAFFVGVFAGLSALAHPNGLILVFSIGCAVVIWQKCKSWSRLVIWAAIGFAITVLPYIIRLALVLQNPEIDFATQMQVGDLKSKLFLITEIARWKGFLKWPFGAGFTLIMFLSWVAAWYRSKPSDKILATSILLYIIVLPVVSVNEACRYLAVTIPFSSGLSVRLVSRIWAGEFFKKPLYKFRAAVVSALIIIYVSTAVPAIGLMFYRLHKAFLDESLNRIASVVGPDNRICGDPIFWVGHDRYQYGPWLMLIETIPMSQAVDWGREHDFDYAVRTAWRIVDFRGIDEPPRSMPIFRLDDMFDVFCVLFGTKVDEFRDPYFGPIEIYKLDWDKYNWPEYYEANRQALRQQ